MLYITRSYACALAVVLLALGGCGTFTGIPSHGGGKRFAIEQELVSLSARKALDELNLKDFKGRNVAVQITVIGDQGGGNQSGGRLVLSPSINAAYTTDGPSTINEPWTISGGIPYTSKSYVDGGGYAGVALAATSLNNYTATPFMQYGDIPYLRSLVENRFILAGVKSITSSSPEITIRLTFDVFGIVRNRTDWLLENSERLVAKVSFEIFALDRQGDLILSPQRHTAEAEYLEKYHLWIGPTSRKVEIRSGGDSSSRGYQGNKEVETKELGKMNAEIIGYGENPPRDQRIVPTYPATYPSGFFDPLTRDE